MVQGLQPVSLKINRVTKNKTALYMKVIIVDDEPKNLKVLQKLIESYCPGLTIVAQASNIKEAETAIQHQKPDILLLDIEMPRGNAFDLLDKIMPVSFEIIFVTAFNEYATKAFKYSALDYLLKPLRIEELQAAVKKAENKLQLKTLNSQLNNLLTNFQKTSVQKIALPFQDGSIIFMDVSEIAYCIAQGAYTKVCLKNKQQQLTCRPLKEYEELLPAEFFFRVHNSYIVNINSIKKYYRGHGGYVEMNDGRTAIEVATRRKEAFLALFGN